MLTRFLIFISILLLAEYFSFSLVKSATQSFPSNWKWGVRIFYIGFTLLTWIGFVAFRIIKWGSLPTSIRNVYIAVVMGFIIAKVLITLVLLIDELRRGGTWTLAKLFPEKPYFKQAQENGISRSQFFQHLALTLGGVSIACFIYGMSNRYNYKLKKVKVASSKINSALKGLRIIQISDIHSGSFDDFEAVAAGVNMIKEQNADLIVFTGDLVNNVHEEILPYKELFASLKAPLGVYSILGNHDYGDYVSWPSDMAKRANLEKLKAIHAEMGWKLMMNEHVVLNHQGQDFALIGIENWGAKANFPKYGDMQKAYAGMEAKQGLFQILLSHDPSHWDAQVRKAYPNIDLTLSGHTHGMQ
ncbi:MAG: metallophosphoesterase, partial [Bacteroidota bacterium]